MKGWQFFQRPRKRRSSWQDRIRSNVFLKNIKYQCPLDQRVLGTLELFMKDFGDDALSTEWRDLLIENFPNEASIVLHSQDILWSCQVTSTPILKCLCIYTGKSSWEKDNAKQKDKYWKKRISNFLNFYAHV